MDEREVAAAMDAWFALWQPSLSWLASFGALESDAVRQNAITGLAGGLVGAPAMPEDFE